MIIKLYIQNQRLDLFADENIMLNSSIADVQDITKNTTEYTKSFTVPASDENNQIFKHYYDFNIDDGFDARIKQDGHIELDGIPFKTGKFRLNKVDIRQNKPYAYTINFWGRLVSFKDLFGDDELKDLDLSAYDHNYTSSVIKTGLTSFLFSGDIVYSLISNRRLYYNSDTLDDTNTDTLGNIDFNGQQVGIRWNELKPSIKVARILNAIETKYGIVFSPEFISRQEFENLYLYLSNSTDSAGGDVVKLDWDGGDNTYIDHTTDEGDFDIYAYSASNTSRWLLDLTITPKAGYENTNYTVKYYKNGELDYEESGTGTKEITFTLEVLQTAEDQSNPNVLETYNVYWELDSSAEFDCTASVRQRGFDRVGVTDALVVNVTTTSSANLISSSFDNSLNMPEIKVVDFIKGLSSMFKWVIIPQDDTNIYINTVDNYYAEGQLLDVTEYTDFSKVEVSRGKILNPISFKFQEPQTILNTEFQKRFGTYYGDLESTLYENEDGSGAPLDGEAFELELPFEQVVYEKLSDVNDESETNIVTAAILDDKLEPVTIKPHLHYISNVVVSANSVGFIDELDVVTEISGAINMPTHSYTDASNIVSTVWGSEKNAHNNNIMQNSLYANYYETYVSNVFNKKRRNVKYSVKNFPLRLLLGLELNDVIQIKSNYYRIDNYDLNLLTGDIDFNLVNSFDNNIGGFYPDKTFVEVDYQIQTENVYVVNGGNMGVVEVDLGDGVGWTDITVSTNDIQIDFNSENEDLTSRQVQLDVTNNDTLQTFSITVIQTGQETRSFRFYLEKNTQYIPLIT
jgi:hypothetical protein